jgi:hypothetical protein
MWGKPSGGRIEIRLRQPLQILMSELALLGGGMLEGKALDISRTPQKYR